MEADQRCRGDEERDQKPEAGGDALRVEIMGEQQKVAEHYRDVGVRRLLSSRSLRAMKRNEHGDAGIAAEESPEFDDDTAQPATTARAKTSPGQAAAPPPERRHKGPTRRRWRRKARPAGVRRGAG